MIACSRDLYSCPDIAYFPSLRSAYHCSDSLPKEEYGLNRGPCQSTVSLSASFRAVYPCNDSPSFSLRTCRWASDSSGWPMRGTGRRHTPAYRPQSGAPCVVSRVGTKPCPRRDSRKVPSGSKPSPKKGLVSGAGYRLGEDDDRE